MNKIHAPNTLFRSLIAFVTIAWGGVNSTFCPAKIGMHGNMWHYEASKMRDKLYKNFPGRQSTTRHLISP